MLREQITAFRAALDAADPKDIDIETRGELVSLGLAAAEKAGEPYTYGIPGSDSNVEVDGAGNIIVSLIYPIKSGQETIDSIKVRVPTVADSRNIKGEGIEAALEKISRTAVTHQTTGTAGRKLALAELEKLAEEDFQALCGAVGFLGERFRRTGKIYKTS